MFKKFAIILTLLGVGTVHSLISEEDLKLINAKCECIPYYQCEYKGDPNKYGEGLLDVRLGDDPYDKSEVAPTS